MSGSAASIAAWSVLCRLAGFNGRCHAAGCVLELVCIVCASEGDGAATVRPAGQQSPPHDEPASIAIITQHASVQIRC